MGASSPWIAQRAPRFLFPALAAAGAALVVWSFVNSLVRLVRRYRGAGGLRLYPVVVSVIEDPLPRIVGCFDEMRRYPADRLVLTYPVKC